MSTMILVLPLVVNAITATRGTGVTNLLTPAPKEVWVDATPDGTAASIKVDLGAVKSIDTIFLGFTNATDTATYSVTGGASSYTTNTYVAAGSFLFLPGSSDVPGARRHMLTYITPASLRYIQINIIQPTGAAPLQAGIFATGLSFVSAEGRDYGSGQTPIDTGSAQQLIDGGFGIGQGVVKSSFAWTYGGLTDTEVRALRSIMLQAGNTIPVLLHEDVTDPNGFTERTHWGLLAKFQQSNRFVAGRTKWDVSLLDWV